MDLLITSDLTCLTYYTEQYGMEHTLYVEIEPHQVAGQVRAAALNEIPVGELCESLRQRGIKGEYTPCYDPSIEGFLPVAVFSGCDDTQGPRLEQRTY